MDQYDVVIIGSGLGGLACGTLLAKEGYKVCVLERNKQVGGNLQTFARDRVIFDSGVHYVGSLEKGQTLYQLFRYLGIMDKLKLHKMDEDIVDGIMFRDDPKVYRYAQGYDRFIKNLVADFPEEEEAIRRYCDEIKTVCSKFPLYNLRSGEGIEKNEVLGIDTQLFLESITGNKKLQSVLAGTNVLYAGEAYKTPLYVHALVTNSYIESAYRFINGGSQIAILLTKEILQRGGEVRKRKHVVKLVEEEGELKYAECTDGERFYGKRFISNIHPVKTLEITGSELIKKAYRNRIKSLDNSISVFSLNIVMKKDTFKYRNHNIYFYGNNDVWSGVHYKPGDWPPGWALFFSTSPRQNGYADGITLMTYMHYEEVKQWENTFNTAAEESDRGSDYERFKKEKAEKLLTEAEVIFPGLTENIQSYYVATPLTVRDYIGSDDGSLYGIAKDYRNPLKTFISPRTKIPNLLLTGQNLNLHGVMGVAMSAVVTCSEIFGIEYLLNKIRNA